MKFTCFMLEMGLTVSMDTLPMSSTNEYSVLVQFNDTFNLNYEDNTVSELLCESTVQHRSFITATFYFSHGKELVEVPDSKLGRYPNVSTFHDFASTQPYQTRFALAPTSLTTMALRRTGIHLKYSNSRYLFPRVPH